MQECLQPPPFSLKIYTLVTLKNRFQLLHCIKMRLRLPADLIEVKKKVCVYLSVCGGCGKDTLPVSLRCDTPSEHGAAFLRSTHCNPWRWRACPAARHYANVNHAWLATRLCVCPSHGFTFHPNFIGASGLFVCFNWINFSETDLCRRAMGRSIAINPARELLTVFILESFNSSEGKEGGGSHLLHFITW